MDKKEFYWETKKGNKINVDDMTIEHLRNVLKMIIRNNNINTNYKESKKELINDLKDDMPFS
jgi:hypothetical protein